jgi:hypothetical protein
MTDTTTVYQLSFPVMATGLARSHPPEGVSAGGIRCVRAHLTTSPDANPSP